MVMLFLFLCVGHPLSLSCTKTTSHYGQEALSLFPFLLDTASSRKLVKHSIDIDTFSAISMPDVFLNSNGNQLR